MFLTSFSSSFVEAVNVLASLLKVSSVSRPRVSFVGSTGHFKFDTDVDIATQNFSLDANNIEISSQEASMSLGEGNIILDGELSKITLGTANPVILQGGNTDNFLALGGKSTFSDEGSGTNGIIIGMDATNPQAEFVKSADNYLQSLLNLQIIILFLMVVVVLI